jgi:hypothetical protein
MPNGPQKIILIRAGRYDYCEIELAGSVQIVGPNNTGKTTLINTLQFLYVDDLRTMNFGAYTLEQTLDYYFPGQYSYVLFECLGATGRSVVGWRGQSKASGGEPERICFSGPYESDVFFDEKRQVREPRDVSARLAFKQLRIVKSAQEHRELLLPPVGADGRGLALVALRDPERFRRFRECLKDLLCLSTITQEQMRHRLLSLADVRSDLPALDVRKLFGDDYDKIRRRRESLARFKKNEEQVRMLVARFADLSKVRGELIARWSDLRSKRIGFEQSHEKALAELREAIAAHSRAGLALGDTLKDRAAARDLQIADKGGLEARLSELERQSRVFESFSPELAETSRQNLKREEMRLTSLLGEASSENRERAQQKVEFFSEQVQHKERSIANFDRLAITALRRHFADDEIEMAFRILNFGLLEAPVGADGITVRDEAAVLAAIQSIAANVQGAAFENAAVRIVLPPSQRGVSDLANVEKLREELKEYTETLARWQRILQAINEREKLADQLRQCRAELAGVERQLFAYEAFVQARSEQPRLERDLQRLNEALAKLDREIAELRRQRDEAFEKHRQAEAAVRAEEDAYNQVMGRFGQCIFPDFTARQLPVADLPPDLDAAVAMYLHQQDHEQKLRERVELLLRTINQLIGEEFNGADDSETIANLAGELDALADKTAALERDWNALIQGLRGTFDSVLKELDAVRSAVTDLNRQFAKVQVSNLKVIRLEVLEAADLVSWIRRLVNLQQPGLFDDDTQLDSTLRNFRQKLEGSPLIGFSQLFSLGITTEAEDGTRRHYEDLKQIESHGTTIAIKVLFNLLVLRHYLREDQCIVPFFLDEVQALDPANRHAILSTARKLGFLAITAAPEAITEVDSLYFLQPHDGRIVLRHRHRLGLSVATAQ